MHTKRGFTLIELLIVIALLGALAIGLIGALDPFEQLKKGTDTGTRDLVNQIQTAVIRYYSVKNEMPWTADPEAKSLKQAPMSGETGAIAAMIAAGELKTDFETIHKGKLASVFVTGSSTDYTVAVCYQPTSKSFLSDPNTKFEIDGTEVADPTTCGTTGETKCYWCIK